MSRNTIPRRTFITRSTASAVSLGFSSLLPKLTGAQPYNANNTVGVGVVGLGNKGSQHVDVFGKLPGVRVVALCDADRERTDKEALKLRDQNRTLNIYQDVRKLLEDKAVDAVVIATPNHWHALMTIWACQAGKDVYVEKPVCHSIWEGLRMLEAEKKYGRIIQGGTQNRSNGAFDEGVAFLREGHLGAIKGIHGVRYSKRPSIGKVRGPQTIPESVDYDLFQGPAPMTGLNRTQLHYDWHWQWATGNGDMGNNAAHTIDDIRRILGDDRQPKRVRSVGGRFGYEDDGETPNTHLTLMDYGDFPVIAEIRNLPHKAGVEYMDNIRGIRSGTVVFCEEGYMTLGWGGANAYSHQEKRIKAWPGDGGRGHASNFIKAVRNQKTDTLNCSLELGALAGEIFHMSNLSFRSGFPASLKKMGEVFEGSQVAEEAWQSVRGNLERNGIDLEKERLTLGSWMSLQDDGRSLKVHESASELVAQYLFLPRNYRSPFVVSEKV